MKLEVDFASSFLLFQKKSTIEVVLFAYFPSVFDIIQALESDIRFLLARVVLCCVYNYHN